MRDWGVRSTIPARRSSVAAVWRASCRRPSRSPVSRSRCFHSAQSFIGGKIAQWSGEIGQIAVNLAPVLNGIAILTVEVPGLDVGGKGGASEEGEVPPGTMAAQDESSAAQAAANDPIPRAPGGGFDLNGRDPSELVPPYARQRPWTPAAPGQGAEHGTEWAWKERDADGNEVGPTIRLRIHSSDPTAPDSPNYVRTRSTTPTYPGR